MDKSVLRNKNFLVFLFGNSTSIFGDIALMTGFSLYVLAKTQSAMQFSLTLVIAFIPRIVLSPFAGVWADQLRKKPTVIFLDIIRGLWLLGLWLLFRSGDIGLHLIYITIGFFAICDTFFGPAYTAIFQRIISKENLSEANAIYGTVSSTINVVSPLIASVLFVSFGLGLLFFIDAVTFMVSAASEFCFAFEDERKTRNLKLREEIVEGIQMIVNNKGLLSLVINGNLTHMILYPFIEVGVIYLLLIVFSAPEYHYGIVRSSISAGAIFSGFIALHYRKRRSIGQNISLGIYGMLIAVLIFEMLNFKGIHDILLEMEYLPVSFLSTACFILFFAFSFYAVFFKSYYQSEVPKDMLGRFSSIFVMTISASRIAGMLIFGALFEAGRVGWALLLLLVGMVMKILVHIPFVAHEKKMKQLEEGASEIGVKSSTG